MALEKYTSSKPYIRKFDQLYLKVVSAPILIFFFYYIWFLIQKKEHRITPMELSSMEIGGTFLTFIALVIGIYVYKIKNINRVRKESRNLHEKLEGTFNIVSKVYWIQFLLFFIALAIFHFTENQWMSLSVWLLFGTLSFEKPSVYRVARYIKFPDRDKLNEFINNETFEPVAK